MKYFKVVGGVLLCLAATIVLTFGINAAFKHEEPLVYITKTGSKYHSEDCMYLWSSAIKIGQFQAEKSGYTPCSRCGGHSCGSVVVNSYDLAFCISAPTVGAIAVIAALFLDFLKRRLKRLEYY